jgi:hypothetical protein
MPMMLIQGGSNITGTDYTLFTHKSVPVIFEAPCILGGSVQTVKENAEVLVVATKEIGLEVNTDKTKYMVMARDQNAGRILILD